MIEPSKSRRRLIVSIVLLVVITGAMALLIDWPVVLVQLARTDWKRLGLATLLLLAGYVFYAIRWRLMLRNQPGFWPTFHSANIGNMANTLLPLRPGDAMRILLLRGHNGTTGMRVTSSLVVERWFEQIMRLAALGGAVIFGAGWAVSPWTVLGSVVFLGGSYLFMLLAVQRRAWLLTWLPRWLARLPRLEEPAAANGLGQLIDGFASLSSPMRMAEALLTSVVTWTFFWGFHALCLLALAPATPTHLLLALSLGSLALVPPSATTLPGMFQLSMVAPMALLGYDRNLLTAYSLILNLVEMVIVNLLGLWGGWGLGVSIDNLLAKKQP